MGGVVKNRVIVLIVATLAFPAFANALTPTPTPTPASIVPCVGDCDQSGSVSLAKVITCVDIALGNLPSFACLACDPNNNGSVQINELQSAVMAALSGCGTDPYEPDDMPSMARVIGCGDTQRHSLSRTGEADWMKLSLDNLSGVIISTSGPQGDPFMQLYDSNLIPIAYNDDFFTAFPRIERHCGQDALAAGDYLIMMGGLGGQIVPQYDIQVTCEPCTVGNPTLTATATETPTPQPDGYEPDNTTDTAKPIACGEIQTHSFAGSSFDDDFVTFTINERSTVHILASGVFQDLPVDLRTTDGSVIESGFGLLPRDCGADALEPGTYIAHTAGFDLPSYNLALLCDACTVPNPTDTPTPTFTPTVTAIPPDGFDDNTRDRALPITCGEGIVRSIAPAGDTDWLVLDVAERSAVTIHGYGGPAIALQNGQGRDLEYQGGAIVRGCGIDALDPGRYFIEVYGFSPFAFPYDLLVSCEPCSVANPPTPAPPTRTPTPTPLPRDAYEPDDAPAEASEIGCGMLQPHSLDTPFDQDWVTFTLTSDSAVTLSAGSAVLTLFDPAGNLVIDGYNSFEITCQQPLHPGRYTLRAACPFCGGAIPAYNLSVLCGMCQPTGTPTATPIPGTPTPTPTFFPGTEERTFFIDPGSETGTTTESRSGLFTTGLGGSNAASKIPPGPLTLVMGTADANGVAPLRLATDVTLPIKILDNTCMCVRLFAQGSGGTIDCDGGTPYDSEARRSAGMAGFGWNATSGLGAPAGAGNANLSVAGVFDRVMTTCDEADCEHHQFSNPPNVFAFTTTAATAIQETPAGPPLALTVAGEPFDCDHFSMAGSGGQLVAPAPTTFDPIGEVANVLRLAEASQ